MPLASVKYIWTEDAIKINLTINACYFLITARRVTSPTWIPPPPCKQALNSHKCFTRKCAAVRGEN